MGIKSFVDNSVDMFGPNQEIELAVPIFKKSFSKNVKLIWDKLENGSDNDSLKELYELVEMTLGNLEFLKQNMLDYSSYSDKEEDFI